MYLVSQYKGDNGMLIDGIDVWERWGLIPTYRLTVTPPEPKYEFVDIPGATASLDVSTITSQYPTYQNRTGAWTFRFIRHPNLGNRSWNQIRTEILNYIHGRICTVELKEDVDEICTKYANAHLDNYKGKTLYYRYKGRLSLSSWDATEHETEVVINYTLMPYKYWALDSQTLKPEIFSNQPVLGKGESAQWDTSSFKLEISDTEVYTMMDEMPMFPLVYYTIKPEAGSGVELTPLSIYYANESLGLTINDRQLDRFSNELTECVITNRHILRIDDESRDNKISVKFKYRQYNESAVKRYDPRVSLIFTPGRL